jgi:hypothetical protein
VSHLQLLHVDLKHRGGGNLVVDLLDPKGSVSPLPLLVRFLSMSEIRMHWLSESGLIQIALDVRLYQLHKTSRANG